MGIKLAKDVRIETVVENHDWISANTGQDAPTRMAR